MPVRQGRPCWRSSLSEVAAHTGRDYEGVVASLDEAEAELARIEEAVTVWLSVPRTDSYAVNAAWFAPSPVMESSAFVHLGLTDSRPVMDRADAVQRRCRDTVGSSSFAAAPLERLHLTLFTALRAAGRRLSDEEASSAMARHADRVASLRPCLVFVLGPRLTVGAVVLECRVYEPSVADLRAYAALDDTARVPRIHYASLGYLTGGSSRALQRLRAALEAERRAAVDIAVPSVDVFWSVTINKAPTRVIERRPLGWAPSGPITTDRAVTALTGLRRSLEHAHADPDLRRLVESAAFTASCTGQPGAPASGGAASKPL